jgi:hypothetical protein
MEHITKVIMNMAKNMELVTSDGLMAHATLESSTTTTYMARVFTLGKMDANMKANGEQTECMEKEHSHGQMAGSL